jgi:UDP-N-acetyl-D-glucosamine dehydrogenase
MRLPNPYVPTLRLDGIELAAQPEEEAKAADCAVIVTDHSSFDYADLVQHAKLIVDTRNALKRFQSEKIVRL